MTKKRVWALVSIFMVALAVVLTLSCGGGGSSSSGGGTSTPSQSSATMDDAAAAKTLSLAMVAGNMSDATDSVTGTFDSTAVGCAGFGGINITKPVLDMILHPGDSYQSLSSESVPCTTSGSMTFDITWNGQAEEPDDCNAIKNIGGSIIFNHCVTGSVEINGTITFTSGVNACKPTTILITYTDFQLSNSEEGIIINTDSFEIGMQDFVFSGDELIGATMVLNGTISAVLDGKNYSVTCSNYTIKMSDDGVQVTMELSGMISGPCLDGLVTVDTIEPIILIGEECPTGGKIKLSGNGEVTVIFNSDGSVDVGSTHYNSCDDLNQGCQ